MKGFINPDNKLSIELTQKTRIIGPSLRTIGKWREEWVSTGNDKRMTFQSYKKNKFKQWHKEKRAKRQTK